MELGAHQARAQRGHDDALCADLLVQSLGEVDDPGLRRGVGPGGGEPGHRCHVDDPAAATAGHRTGGRVGELHGGLHMQAQQRALVVEVGLHEVGGQPVPGVVDQQEHRVPRIGESLLDGRDAVVGDQVSDEHSGLHPVLGGERLGLRLEAVGVAGDEHQVISLGRELAGEGGSQPCGGAGDHSGMGTHVSILGRQASSEDRSCSAVVKLRGAGGA